MTLKAVFPDRAQLPQTAQYILIRLLYLLLLIIDVLEYPMGLYVGLTYNVSPIRVLSEGLQLSSIKEPHENKVTRLP